MRGFRLLAIAAAMAVSASLHAAPDNSELTCIFDRAARADLEAGWTAMHEHRNDPTAAEAEAAQRVLRVVTLCTAQYHWSEARSSMALSYAIERGGYEAAQRNLAARGITPAMLDRIWSDLGERGRTALANGDPANGNLEFVDGILARDLANAPGRIEPGGPEQYEMSRALAARMNMDRAIEAFNAP